MDILITLLLITLPLLNITKLNHQYEYYHQEELVIILISGMVSGIVVSISSLRINGDDGFNNYGGDYNNNSNGYHEGKSVRDENHENNYHPNNHHHNNKNKNKNNNNSSSEHILER